MTQNGLRHVESEIDFQQIIEEEDTVLVDFHADWCGPCQMMAPMIDEIAKETDDTIAKVDVDEIPGIATEYGIRAIPSFLLFQDGTVEQTLTGVQQKEDLLALLH